MNDGATLTGTNLINDWLNLLDNEFFLAEQILKEIKFEVIGKVFNSDSEVKNMLMAIAKTVAEMEGYDLEHIWEIDTVFDIVIEQDEVKFSGVKLIDCKIKNLFLHEKIM